MSVIETVYIWAWFSAALAIISGWPKGRRAVLCKESKNDTTAHDEANGR